MDWSNVDHDAFISCLDSYSDGTHSLQRINLVRKWCNVKFIQICSDEDQLFYILDGLNVQQIFIFGELFL